MGDERDYKPYSVKWTSDEGEVENWLVDGCTWDSTVEMAEKKADNRSVEIWTRPPYDAKREDPLHENLMYSRLSLRAQTELDAITAEMVDEAKSMVDDYSKNPSSLSGSMDVERGMVRGDGVVIHENSPLLKEKKIAVSTYEQELNRVKELYDIDANGMVRCDESGNPIKKSGKDED